MLKNKKNVLNLYFISVYAKEDDSEEEGCKIFPKQCKPLDTYAPIYTVVIFKISTVRAQLSAAHLLFFFLNFG